MKILYFCRALYSASISTKFLHFVLASDTLSKRGSQTPTKLSLVQVSAFVSYAFANDGAE